MDLRGGVDDAESIDLLVAAIRGEPPSALFERTRRAVAELCPHRGLEIFREEDAPFFFGREAFTEHLAETAALKSLVAVVGSSGSGKSSVVRAGLVPRLRRPDGNTVWEVVTLVPGRRPLQALAGALLPLLEPQMTETERLREINNQAGYLAKGEVRLEQVVNRVLEKQPGTDRLLLVVDQWEELYSRRTLEDKDEEKDRTAHKQAVIRFIDELLAATDASPLSVVLTLRADFYGEILAHRGLSDRLQAAQVNLAPMKREELERAVTAPAQKVDLSFEEGLVDRLLDDVGDEPGNLPLLEFALKALWSARRGSQLLHDVYKAMGGVKGAIAKRRRRVPGVQRGPAPDGGAAGARRGGRGIGAHPSGSRDPTLDHGPGYRDQPGDRRGGARGPDPRVEAPAGLGGYGARAAQGPAFHGRPRAAVAGPGQTSPERLGLWAPTAPIR